MARYFFNVRHKPGTGGLAIDPDGNEIADENLISEHALAVARDLIARTHLDSISNWFDCTFEITDNQGRQVAIVPFTDAVVTDDDPSDQTTG